MSFLSNYQSLQDKKKKTQQQEAAKPILTRGVQTTPNLSAIQMQTAPISTAPSTLSFNQSTPQGPRMAPSPAAQTPLPPNQSTTQGQRFAAPTIIKAATPTSQQSNPVATAVKSVVPQQMQERFSAAGQALKGNFQPLQQSFAQQNKQLVPKRANFTNDEEYKQAVMASPITNFDMTGGLAATIKAPVAKAISKLLHPEDANVLIKAIDAIRLKGKPNAPSLSEQDWTAFERIMTRTGQKLDANQTKLADHAQNLLEGVADTSALYKTGKPFLSEMGTKIKTAYQQSPFSDESGFVKNPFASEPTPPKGMGLQQTPQSPGIQEAPRPDRLTPRQSLSLSNDVNQLKVAPELNLSKLDISSKGKELIKSEAEALRPKLSEIIGKPLSNAEVVKNTEASSKIFKKAVTREQTKDWTTALLNTRQQFADMAETGVVDRQFVETLATLRSIASDAGRKLQSFSIEAKPAEMTLKQYMLENMLDLGHNIDDLVEQAKGVDFNNYNEAAAFYRKFVKPKASEWIDLLRYNSMLTSPLTHIVNITSNLANSALIAPLEKLTVGGFDFIRAAATGTERRVFAGEAAQLYKGFYDNMGEATRRFAKSLKGDVPTTNLDTRNIPLTQKGTAANKVEMALSAPLKFLEAGDQFFTALLEGAERAAHTYRQSKGVKVDDFESKVTTAALYRLYRQEPGAAGQGHLLDAVDQLTLLLQRARTSKNPIVSTISKFTFPFVRTPMNIFKQGIEYSPLGYFNLYGATDKQTVLARAAIGSAIFGGAATLLASGRLTWAEPSNETEKNAFKAAGRQPYSVKIGDEWVSYQKLPPPLAFPISMVAAINDAIEQDQLDENTGQLILHAVAKYGSFLSDQSYAKSMGDLVSAFQGEESSMEKLASNYPQQLIPYRALGGWLSRLTDHVQRKPDPDGSFIDKQVQLLMMNIPGLSDDVPARKDSDGNPIPAPNPIKNAFSPVRSSPVNSEKEEDFQGIQDIKRLEMQATHDTDLLKTQAQDVFNEFENLSRADASRKLIALKRSNPALAERVQDLRDLEKVQYTDYEKKLKNASVEARAQMILKDISSLKGQDRIAKMRELEEKKILSKSVSKRLKELQRENR